MADEVFVASREPAKNGYGQNGYQGPSSDLPGQHTTSGFLPQSKVPDDKWQTRKVSSEPIKTHPGMSARDDKIDFPKDNVHPSKGRLGGHFQR